MARPRKKHPAKYCPVCGVSMSNENSAQRRKEYCSPQCVSRGLSKKLSGKSQPHAPSHTPTPDEIEAKCLEFQGGWTEVEEQNRRGVIGGMRADEGRVETQVVSHAALIYGLDGRRGGVKGSR